MKKKLQRTSARSSYYYFFSLTATPLLCCFLLPFNAATAVLVGSILLPHGDFAYDPTLFEPHTEERRIATQIAIGSRRAGRWLIDEAKPDIIFLSTPHGIKLDNDFGLYMASTGGGSAVIGDDLYDDQKKGKEYNVSLEDVNLAPALAVDLLTELLAKAENVSGIYSYNDGTAMPLNWGEIIPLLLLPQSFQQKCLLLSMPQRRYDHGPEMVPELLRLGQEIEIWAQNRPERIAVIISGDLSHTHQPEGPYGYSNTSAIFDRAIGHWASSPCERADSLLQVASNLQPTAMSCGYTGYVLWHGIMACGKQSRTKYESKLLVNRNVTYYGMMSAIFAPIKETIRSTS
jgi:aromatic ring-opening dioxygenase LigB subunit